MESNLDAHWMIDEESQEWHEVDYEKGAIRLLSDPNVYLFHRFKRLVVFDVDLRGDKKRLDVATCIVDVHNVTREQQWPQLASHLYACS